MQRFRDFFAFFGCFVPFFPFTFDLSDTLGDTLAFSSRRIEHSRRSALCSSFPDLGRFSVPSSACLLGLLWSLLPLLLNGVQARCLWSA